MTQEQESTTRPPAREGSRSRQAAGGPTSAQILANSATHGLRVHVKLAATCFVLYAFYANIGPLSDNEAVRYALCRAIADRGTFRLDAFSSEIGVDLAQRGEHVYCDKPPGSSLLMLPQYILARALVPRIVQPQRPGDRQPAMLVAWIVTCLSVCLYSALSVAIFYDVLRLLGVRRGRILYCYAFAVATLTFPYATFLVGAQFTAPLVVAAVWLALRGRSRADLFGLGLVVGVTFLTHYHAILLVGWLIPLQWLKLDSKRRILWALAPALACLAALLGYNWVCFGNPFSMSYSHWQGGKVRFRLALPTRWQLHLATFSSWRGLFYYSPWLLLYFGGLVRAWRQQRLWAAYLAISVGSYIGFLLLNNQPDGHYWWGGGDYGPRAFVPAVPIIAAGAVLGLDALAGLALPVLRRLAMTAVAAAIVWSVFACGLGAITTPVSREFVWENGAFYVQPRPGAAKEKLAGVANPMMDLQFKYFLNYGTVNIVTQLWRRANVVGDSPLSVWLLNVFTNVLPLAFMALVWRREIAARLRERD